VISAQFPFPAKAIFAPPLRRLFTRVIDTNASNEEIGLISTLFIQKHSAAEAIAKVASPEEGNVLTFGPLLGQCRRSVYT
jgi:hypothetical protein